MEHTAEEIQHIRLNKRLVRLFRKACADYRLIEDGDRILIGLSGGKDSLALTEFLGEQAQIYVPRFEVRAVHVSLQNIAYQADLDYLARFCEAHKVPFEHVVTGFEPLEEHRNPCFLCSWYRRKALFEAAQRLGCNKIALGHHQDDIIETLLMNLVFEGTFGTIAPSLRMDKFPITMIRPLCLMQEKDLQAYAEAQGYAKQVKLCPFEKVSARAKVKGLVSELEQLNPEVRSSIWNAMSNIKAAYLPPKVEGAFSKNNTIK